MINFNKYKNYITKFIKTVNALEPAVYSFGMITFENYAGSEIKEDFEKYLNLGLIRYVFITEKCCGYKNIFLVINVNLGEMLHLAKKYTRRFFLYAKISSHSDKIILNNYKKAVNGKFYPAENTDDGQDLHFIMKNFEKIKREIKTVYGHLMKKQITEINEINKELSLSNNMNLKHFYLQRGGINYIIKNKYNIEWHKKKEGIIKNLK
jgi:hypothetical protein